MRKSKNHHFFLKTYFLAHDQSDRNENLGLGRHYYAIEHICLQIFLKIFKKYGQIFLEVHIFVFWSKIMKNHHF